MKQEKWITETTDWSDVTDEIAIDMWEKAIFSIFV